MRLTEDVLTQFNIAKVMKDNTQPINTLCYSKDGEILVTSSHDASISTYNCHTGTKQKTIYSKKYGANLVRFTHHHNAIVYASSIGWDESIRYLSLHDNSYVRYFKGHRDRVTSLSMNPVNDTFMTGSLDGTVRLWDLRTENCQGLMRTITPSVIAHDHGQIVVVASHPNIVKLFNLKFLDNGPIDEFSINGLSAKAEWNEVIYNPDTKSILLSSSDGLLLVMDALSGDIKHRIKTSWGLKSKSFKSCFSPDGQFILSGSESGDIDCWSTKTGELLVRFQGHHAPSMNVAWNPKKMLICSACNDLAMWLPKSSTST